MMTVYEELGLPVTASFVQEFLQYPMVAADFAAYYALYEKYRSDYQLMHILKGQCPEEIRQRAEAAPYEERVTLVHLLFEALLSLTERAGAETAVRAWKESFAFLESCWGTGMEMQIFVREIQKSAVCTGFLTEYCPAEYCRFGQLFQEQEQKRRYEENCRMLFQKMTE